MGVLASRPDHFQVVEQNVAAPNSQQWALEPLVGSIPQHYVIRQQTTGLAVTFPASVSGKGDNIILTEFNPLNPQQVVFLESTGQGYVAVLNATTGLILNVDHALTANDTPIIAWTWDGGLNSQWMIAPI
jgi:hypothetical protein